MNREFKISVFSILDSVFKPKGFTIMEMVVVLAVFSVVAVVTADIFFTVTRAQKRVVQQQQVQSDVRFSLDTIAREIHQGFVDYDYYASQVPALYLVQGSQVQPQTVLALRDAAGVAVRFRQTADTLQVCRGQCTSWEPLVSENIQVPKAVFYLVPGSDPFAQVAGVPDDYPRVTMVLSAQSAAQSQLPLTTFFLQTTVAARSYRR
ncbi:MAG: prepilin-type N-terminal cleavage/methylation domain-containing protein [Candidatus Kerfeldbacteria bacterium]|nr:prepilin-type N-terminal cleavage/methylation domain-containing protein [Candidatus Kerfeldbacteria bacterium]